ncbi:hypothetical protein Tco_0007807 [Tanacetum coccineum]
MIDLKRLNSKITSPSWNRNFGDDNKLPVIIAKELSLGEKADLIKVLKSHKRALAWKLSDIQGINPGILYHKILMEETINLQCSSVRLIQKSTLSSKNELKNFLTQA